MVEETATGFRIRPMPVGAEVIGLAPGAEQHPQVRRALYEAWLAHGFLLFRGIDTAEQQLAVSASFGELELHPVPEIRLPENPYLVQFGGAQRGLGYVYDEEVRSGRIPWHRDTAFTPAVCKGGMLRVIQRPKTAGETLIADTARAYDDLPAALRRRVDSLEYATFMRSDPLSHLGPWASWSKVRLPTTEEDPLAGVLEPIRHKRDRYPSVVHPVVLQHPESGRRCLFLTPRDFGHFLGMSRTESDALLAELMAHMLQPQYVYVHAWADGDALFWDNLRCMHAAAGYDPKEGRHALRTTLAGSLRTGRYAEADAALADRGEGMEA